MVRPAGAVSVEWSEIDFDKKLWTIPAIKMKKSSVWVKRVKIRWDGMELISDNREEYPPIILSKDEAENLQVIGQLVHLGKNMI